MRVRELEKIYVTMGLRYSGERGKEGHVLLKPWGWERAG